MGWGRNGEAHVSRLKKEGHLVIAGGKIDYEASKAKLAETKGARDDVAARHAHERGSDMPVATPTEARALETRAEALSRKESAQADLAELEYKQRMGQVVDRAEVDALFADVTTLFRQLIENQPHRLAPNLVQKDLDAVRAILKEDAQQMIGDLWKEADRRIKELGVME